MSWPVHCIQFFFDHFHNIHAVLNAGTVSSQHADEPASLFKTNRRAIARDETIFRRHGSHKVSTNIPPPALHTLPTRADLEQTVKDASASASTRPQLHALTQDRYSLDEQILQAAHIIGLPDTWPTIQEKTARAGVISLLVRARAEWVLRWILDRMKDETDLGNATRTNISAWLLLDWMIQALPVSRSAPHLRDASLPTILERTLSQAFGTHTELQGPEVETAHLRDASDSSNTMSAGSPPSRKRKRGTNAMVSSTVGQDRRDRLKHLFGVLCSLLRTLTSLASDTEQTNDSTQTELVRMVLRTDSAQASRILDYWLKGVHQLVESSPLFSENMEWDSELVDLSLVVHIWELRSVGPTDVSGSSAEEFNTQCLISALQLSTLIYRHRAIASSSSIQTALEQALQSLDKLLVRHLLTPSRAAFLAAAGALQLEPQRSDTITLAELLAPLRARLLQAVLAQNSVEAFPNDLLYLFDAPAHLLDLIIRASPSRTPRARVSEKPWIQAACATLAECVGCSLVEPPEFATQALAAAALRKMLQVLKTHNITLQPEMLTNLFWYHCGVKYPQQLEKSIHWSLIAALIELDASVFVTEPYNPKKSFDEPKNDIAEFVFEQISASDIQQFLDLSPGRDFSNDMIQHQCLILDKIIVPLLLAFAQNRNLPGFIRRWDHQLTSRYRHVHQNPLTGKYSIWEDRAINRALANVFESVLTSSQIAGLLDEHGKRLIEFDAAMDSAILENVQVKKLATYESASSSAVIVFALLQSIESDEILASCTIQLLSLFQIFTKRVQDDRYSFHTKLDASWITLCRLLIHLWPIELHASQTLQQDLLYPTLERAGKDSDLARQNTHTRHLTVATPAAATLFLLESCNCLHTLPGSVGIIRANLTKAVEALTTRLCQLDQSSICDVFCARFAHLLGYLEISECTKALVSVLSMLAESTIHDKEFMLNSLSQTIFEVGKDTLQAAYSEALLEILPRNQNGSCQTVARALLHVDPSALSRMAREKFLDLAVQLIEEEKGTVDDLLALMAHLMVVPNATAKISTNGKTMFDMATKLNLRASNTPATLHFFWQLIHSTLQHIVPNHAQPQARAFIEQFTSKVDQVAKAPEKCTFWKLAILRAAVPFQGPVTLLKLKPYIELLKICLTGDNIHIASHGDILNALNEIPRPALEKAKVLREIKKWLQNWIDNNSDLESLLGSNSSCSPEMAEYVACLQGTIAQYNLFPNIQWLVKLTMKLPNEVLPAWTVDRSFNVLGEALSSLTVDEKLDLVSFLLGITSPAESAVHRTAAYRVLNIVITTLDDRLEANDEIKQIQLGLLPRLCVQLAQCANDELFNALLDCVNNVLNNKPSLTSQHSIESILGTLSKIASRSSPPLPRDRATSIFARLCETTRLILLVHRGRLGGRFHLLLPLLQHLLFCFFVPSTGRSGARPFWLRTEGRQSIRLSPANASQYTRLVATLCNPPQSSITKAHQRRSLTRSKELNDPIRAARERASTFLYPLLASYCRFTLFGRLDADIREQLKSGMWEIMSTARLRKESLDAMFAGLGRSEQDVWRGVWAEWESVFGKKSVVVGE